MSNYVIWFQELSKSDIDKVGGKNASLGEMISNLADAGVSVPGGFATTADAYREFLEQSGLDKKIHDALDKLDINDVNQLAETGREIRESIINTPLPQGLESAIREAYASLEQEAGNNISVAVRSSATAEDLPDASFAGQQETFLNIEGVDNVLHAVKEVFASLFNDRAISYRVHQGFEHRHVALSAGIQRMVRSDTGASGVMFSLDTESGFRDVVFVTAAYGLGETVVQGQVNPDEFYVHKPTLAAGRPAVLRRNLGSKAVKMIYGSKATAGKSVETVDVDKEDRQQFCISDDEVQELARQCVTIEQHYGHPVDVEWARDGNDGKLYVVQARPETVKSRQTNVMERYLLKEKGKVLVEGRSIGHRIGSGAVRLVTSLKEMDKVQTGDVLVTDMTDPDWEPVMKRASAIVTNRGGRTCHAAIIARELGIPAVVGCGDATEAVTDGNEVTVSCAEGDTGRVYEGKLAFEHQSNSVESMPDLPFEIMMNVGNPDRAFDFQSLPNAGVGLARLEFIINRMIGVHPKALLNFDDQPRDVKQIIERRIGGYASPVDFYVDKLVEGISTLAAAFYPKKVIVRMSDFKSNEYGHLIGGDRYEPSEENPMLGFRGAARYISDNFRDCFELECRAIKRVRDEMKLTNVEVMVPFVRTPGEAKQVVEMLASNGLKRGVNGLRLIMMCEIPSNALLADQFLEHFDGFSIGSNDLTQLTLGLDRDSGIIAHLFDERNEAVKRLLAMAIEACRKQNKYVGICGQGPSDHPDLARWLMEQGISTVSLNPDSVLDTWFFLANEKA